MRFHRLLEKAKSAQAILDFSPEELQSAQVSFATALEWKRAFRDPLQWKRTDEELERASSGEFQILSENDENYPLGLRSLVDRPPVLYVKGKWPPWTSAIGLVGTRYPSDYGIDMAQSLARQLSRCQVVTVSGLALGIDGAVHQATLEAKGFTIAALGHGLKYQYPRANRRLFEKIPEQGCLVTEFPFGQEATAGHFPRRNRIISGLSQGVVVIEGAMTSGALITARYAAEQGKDVFAVPGRVGDPRAAGPNHLIKEGAGLVEGVRDLLHDAKEMIGENTSNFRAEEKFEGLEAEIMQELRRNPAAVDELAFKLRRPVDQLAGTLISLEIQGKIRQKTGQRYGIDPKN